MNWKTWLPLLVAVVLGLVAMKVARDVIANNHQGPRVEGGTQIVVLKTDLPAGAALKAADLGTAKMGGELASGAVFTDVAELEGRVLTTAALKGSPVLETMLAPKGSGTGLQALIPDGMRAITIEINEFSGVAGNLVPGCRVDVVSSFNGDANGEMVSRTIVQNVKVTALGSRRAPENEQAGNGNNGGAQNQIKSVTLLATPKEAEAIELATATGRPRLILRSGKDGETLTSEGISVAELRHGTIAPKKDPFQQVELIKPVFSKPTTAPAGQPLARTRQVKVIRGGVESEVTIEDPELAEGPRWITGNSTEELPSNERR